MVVARLPCGPVVLAVAVGSACASTPAPRPGPPPPPASSAHAPGEDPVPAARVEGPPTSGFLGPERQLTLDGAFNAGPCFEHGDQRVYFHGRVSGRARAQVFSVDLDGRNLRRVSPDEGFAVDAAPGRRAGHFFLSSAHLDAAGVPLPSGITGDDELLDVYEVEPRLPAPRRLTRRVGADVEAAPSPDGRRLALVQRGAPGTPAVLALLDLESLIVSPLVSAQGVASPAWMPDGRAVVYAQRVSATATELFVAPVDGGAARQLTTLGASAGSPAVHPSGRWVLFSAPLAPNRVTPGNNRDLYAMDLGDGTVHRVTSAEGDDDFPAFSSDGSQVAWVSTRQGGLHQVFVAPWLAAPRVSAPPP